MVKIELDSKTADRLLDILDAAEAEIHSRKSALKGLTVAETYNRLRACETVRDKLRENPVKTASTLSWTKK